MTSKSNISLRLIDWLVTHYAKAKKVQYWIHEQTCEIYLKQPTSNDILNKCRKFNLYDEYRAQLKSFTKKFFDPFRRHDRISYIINENDTIETTIGQLNFFKWFLKNNVHKYISILMTDDILISSIR